VSALIDSDAKYQDITWFHVDWDTYKNDPVATDLSISRRSVLVGFKGGEEVSRVVAQTGEDALQALLDATL